MTAREHHSEARIEIPLNVWPGPATTAEITTETAARLAAPGQRITIVDTGIDPVALAATGRAVTWIATSRRAIDAASAALRSVSDADRSRLMLLHAPRAVLVELLSRHEGRSRLTIAPAHLAARPAEWTATIATLQPQGRLVVIDAAGPAALPPSATAGLTFQAHLVCAATEVFQRAAAHAEALTGEFALPVALTRLHRDIALFCRAEVAGGAR
ncbi:hypothetical protein L0U85_03305 [Glycomyces sp. L485]|uniref:hypothetical protein n=1 Tax=Glycomyces sp. L485 TaxID=2909235 RepID=UPI001F4B9200|nr:hypothetical protein [Glycomyces sp. L485]MCH7229889.1 hypothetical protein [Glycomyces sp. L485]